MNTQIIEMNRLDDLKEIDFIIIWDDQFSGDWLGLRYSNSNSTLIVFFEI